MDNLLQQGGFLLGNREVDDRLTQVNVPALMVNTNRPILPRCVLHRTEDRRRIQRCRHKDVTIVKTLFDLFAHLEVVFLTHGLNFQRHWIYLLS